MKVSPVCEKDGEKFACVQFTDGSRIAEGKIPTCNIVSSNGFSDEEVAMLENYMRANLTDLKKLAAKQNTFKAMLGGNDEA